MTFDPENPDPQADADLDIETTVRVNINVVEKLVLDYLRSKGLIVAANVEVIWVTDPTDTDVIIAAEARGVELPNKVIPRGGVYR